MTPLTFVTLLGLTWGLVGSAPLVSSPWGRIAGRDATSPGGQAYSAYLAIPYALPPVDQLRFCSPVPHPGPGADTLNATSPGLVCPQLTPTVQPLLGEDCLTLDVFVPLNPDGTKSVIVFIHGGSFVIGASPLYTPSELVTENDVIVVVIQYRLGVLGFLSSGDAAAPGNYGLLDQNLAIRWVRGNIQAFGGDAETITIYGQSAGAASVGLHLLSPFSKGLFTRAILQSGTPLGSWSCNENPKAAFDQVALLSGCKAAAESIGGAYFYTTVSRRQQAEHERVVACLRTLDVATLLKFTTLPFHSVRSSEMFPWAPVVDGDFLPRNPQELLRDENYLLANDVIARDVMLGLNNAEGAYLLPVIAGLRADTLTVNPSADLTQLNHLLQVDIKLVRNLIQEELVFRYRDQLRRGSQTMELLADVIEFFYTQPLVEGQPLDQQAVTNTFGDIFFNVPTARFLRDLLASTEKVTSGSQHSSHGSRFLYLYNHYPNRTAAQELSGISHIEDIPFIFDANNFFPRDAFTTEDFTVGTTFRTFLSNFAKTGDPQVTVAAESGTTWPEYSLATESYLSLEATPRVDTHLFAKRVALWLDLLPDMINRTRDISAESAYRPKPVAVQ